MMKMTRKMFFGVFNTFVSQWCVENDKNVLSLHLGSYFCQRSFWKLPHIKNPIFNTTAILKCCKYSIFVIPQNAAKRSIYAESRH